MKKILFVLLLLFSVKIFSQAEYVAQDNLVYNFLERMETQHIISGYNSFEVPKTRKEIADYLKEVIDNNYKLDNIDQKILDDLKQEFEFELFGTLKNSTSMIGGDDYSIFSQKQKYLYYMKNTSKMSMFVNIVGEAQELALNDNFTNKNLSTGLGVIGGEIRGTISNKFGFYLRGTNGTVFGNKEAARLREDIRYNFKFNENNTDSFFDETQGYLTADFDLVKFKIGRDRLQVGYGPVKSIVGNTSPLFNYLGFNIKYSFFTFSYFHGQILGDSYYQNDSVTQGIEVVKQKYIGYHRLGFNISNDINFGVGEVIVYGDRPIDLSYLNPFSFYKSVEHSNRDRDNSMLFFDVNNKSIKGLKLYGTLLLDDVSFGKIKTNWWGNQFIYNFGFYSTNLYRILPLGIKFEYLRISPYVYTHRISNNNYTNFGYPIASFVQPNSELFYCELDYRFTNRLSLQAGYSYTLHGANPKDNNGNVIRNVGGDITLGHRAFDSENTTFLDGAREYLRNVNLSVEYEPIKQIFAKFKLIYTNSSLQNSGRVDQLQTFFTLSATL